jgi:hypothetical protein
MLLSVIVNVVCPYETPLIFTYFLKVNLQDSDENIKKLFGRRADGLF